MAGHSKWANIKHRKGAQDAKRSKLFSKVVKDIMVAARVGGPDPDANPRLRLAITKAKAVSLPRENLDRAVKKGAGLLDGVTYEEARYEAYGPGGVAIIIECVTDNRNRTSPEIRHIFTKRGMNLGEPGSAVHSFQRVGQVLIGRGDTDEERLMMSAMEHGADDILQDVDDSGSPVFQVICEVSDLEALREGLEQDGFELQEYGLSWIPNAEVDVAGADAEKLLALLDLIEDNDDVQNLYANYAISDDEMIRIVGGS
jgi:YebC/PmpR family DNA-binding regulatory protein